MTSFPTSAVAIGKGLQYSRLGEANQAMTVFISQGGVEPTQYTCVYHTWLCMYTVCTVYFKLWFS